MRWSLAAFAVLLFVKALGLPIAIWWWQRERVSRMDLFANLATGFAVALTPANLGFCLLGALIGTLVGVLPGHRADHHHRDPAAVHILPGAGIVADHARGHFLRRAIWRLDHGHPGQCAGRILGHRHLSRRASDGEAGPRRPGARDRGHRLVLRRHHCDDRDRDRERADDLARAQVQCRRIFQPDGAGPHRRGRARAWRAGKSRRHGAGRPAARPRRHRRQFRRAAHDLRSRGACRRHRLRAGRDRPVRHRRTRGDARPAAGAQSSLLQAQQSVADARRHPRLHPVDPARHRDRLRSRRAARRRRGAVVLRGLCGRKEISSHAGAFRPRRDRRRRRAGSRQQCRRAGELHSAAHARHSRQCHHGADGRRA